MKKLCLFAVILSISLFEPSCLLAKCHVPERGPPGPQGPVGPQGPSGGGGGPTLTSAYGSFYIPETTLLAFNDIVPFTQTSGSLNTSLTGTGAIVLDLPGTYLVTYGLSVFQYYNSPPINIFKLTFNGSDIPGSFSSWEGGYYYGVSQIQTVSVIVNANTAGVLNLVNISTPSLDEDLPLSLMAPIEDEGHVVAYIMVLRLNDATPSP